MVYRLLAALALAPLLSGCFAPTYTQCTVSCGPGGLCPGGLECRGDGYCHQQGVAGYCVGTGALQCLAIAPEGTPSGFQALGTRTIGSGEGTITGSSTTGPNIGCPGLCSVNYPDNEQIGLVAAPVDNESTFEGWLGDCSGTAPCLFRMDATKTVCAVFFGGAVDDAWSQSGSGDDAITSMSIDFENSVAVGGFFGGGATVNGDIDLGDGSMAHAGEADGFAALYSGDGTIRWSRRFGGPGIDGPVAVTQDRASRILLAGSFDTAATLDDVTATSGGGVDLFVGKYFSDGSHDWLDTYGGLGDDHARGVGSGANDDLYVVGDFTGQLVFGARPALNAVGGRDIFVAKFDSSGAPLWAQSFGGNGDDFAYDVSDEEDGQIAVVGSIGAEVNFGGVPLGGTAAPNGFLLKLNAGNGTHAWSMALSGAGSDEVRTVDISDRNLIAVGGVVEGDIDFGAGVVPQINGADAFVAAYADPGLYRWAHRFGGNGADEVNSVSWAWDDGSGRTIDLLVTGTIFESANLGVSQVTASSGDIFVARYDQAGNPVWSHAYAGGNTDRGRAVVVRTNRQPIVGGQLASSLTLRTGLMINAPSPDALFQITLFP